RAPTSTFFPYTTLFRSIGLLASTMVFCQGSATKAEEYYADLNYPMAIESYEKYVSKLKEDKPDREVITQLANSYFFTNDYLKARSEEHTSELQSRENLV